MVALKYLLIGIKNLS